MNRQYFRSERLTDHTTRIYDILGVALYLVEGEEKACVIDTGHGLGNLREYVETLTDKPTFVVLTHGHIDHANAAALWDEVYMSPLDLEVYAEHSSIEKRRGQFLESDLTKDIPVEEYNPIRTAPFLPLSDGQLFDLGSITLEAVAAPGHTPGMTMILIREERIMLFGDGCGLEVLMCFPSSSPISAYLKVLEHIKTYESRYDRIIRNHGTCESPKELLDNCISCCLDILNGCDAKQPANFREIPVLSARPVDPRTHARLDGRQGNILYIEEKRC
ncbi:MAG: MBL fold metallo-hydrolase [Lachnospiraceae bacterium]|nr:MBL fold metallo-hydrolase [Lachnospiraceae bacterium]